MWRRSTAVEQHPAMVTAATVEPERELVEVAVELLAADAAMVGSQQPPPDEGRHAMHMGDTSFAGSPLALTFVTARSRPSGSSASPTPA
jgi:hypothetical protein